jgi:myo-inositol-hexaphosphate 3-phosphohydrolase
VEAAAAFQDISVLYVPEEDLALAQQKANERGGVEVRGIARVEDLLVDEGGDAGLWVTEA